MGRGCINAPSCPSRIVDTRPKDSSNADQRHPSDNFLRRVLFLSIVVWVASASALALALTSSRSCVRPGRSRCSDDGIIITAVVGIHPRILLLPASRGAWPLALACCTFRPPPSRSLGITSKPRLLLESSRSSSYSRLGDSNFDLTTHLGE
jgi:hypothetical protein